ncbi:MAG: protein kinase [Armatimonadia bacterium]
MSIDDFISELRDLGQPGPMFKPHKYLAMLAVIELIRRGRVRDGCVFFNAEFRECFTEVFATYAGPNDRDRPLAPFFHLRSSSFWELVPCDGKEAELARTTSVGSPAALSELVSHAQLDGEVFDFLQVEATRQRVDYEIISRLTTVREGSNAAGGPAGTIVTGTSPGAFPHEAAAIEDICKRLTTQELGYALANRQIHDRQSNRYFETDLILVCPFGIYVVELKHWSGQIDIRPYSWLLNRSSCRPDPHLGNSHKAKLLRGMYDRGFAIFPEVFVESVVVLTNPEATVNGAADPDTTTSNPTFDGTKSLIAYLKRQRERKGTILQEAQVKAFCDYLEELTTPNPPRDYAFPGYEVVERLYQSEDRAEVIARPTGAGRRRLSRLRVFFPPPPGSGEEREELWRRAQGALESVLAIGDHPNILKVWRIPSEMGYLVEGSDWSESGTLRDRLQDREPLQEQDALTVAEGVLQGLQASHERDVIHRALSPENVVMAGGVPKLTNFDLSYRLEEEHQTVILDAERLPRSPYIAPEVYYGGDLTEAADLFSLGVVLFELLTGRPPFACSTDLEKTGGGLAEVEAEALVGVSARARALVSDLVRQEPSQRLATAAAVLARLAGDDTPPRLPVLNPVLEPGTRNDLYEIECLIKQGVEAQLYRAVGPRGRLVVVKLFGRDVPQWHGLEEQQFAGAVHHPGIVRVENHSTWEGDGRFYIAFQRLSERSLRNEISAGLLPDLDQFAAWATQLLEALAALHGHRGDDGAEPILHNDIKPENILLTDSRLPVIVDFGCASFPKIAPYQGTEGYVPPDLRSGQDRDYCEQGDLFALGVTLFEWYCGRTPYTQLQVGVQPAPLPPERRALGPELELWFAQAVATEANKRFGTAAEMLRALQRALPQVEAEQVEASAETPAADLAPLGVPEREEAALTPIRDVQPTRTDREAPTEIARGDQPEQIAPFSGPQLEQEQPEGNAFVAYLNSLHCRRGGSKNSLAESQATNPLFGSVQVAHPLADVINELLLGETRTHVVLTGHAGDGKSIILLQCLKRFRNQHLHRPLQAPLERREDSQVEALDTSLVKDLSEWDGEERAELLAEMLAAGGPRFLLVSNSGTLLETFRQHEQALKADWRETESALLTALEQAGPRPLHFHGVPLQIINLSKMDNLPLVERLFRRLLEPANWDDCEGKACRSGCPIRQNAALLQQHPGLVTQRLLLAYRRMYEYGARLTLRQASAHLAYMLTSGLSCAQAASMVARSASSPGPEYMFFNRFFGDDGRNIDLPALQLQAVRLARAQGFGRRLCAAWERRLWQSIETRNTPLVIEGLQDVFQQLCDAGAGRGITEEEAQAVAREQARRVLFFLYAFDEDESERYLTAYLDSPMIIRHAAWQQATQLDYRERKLLQTRLFQVLQEHLTGVRLPEGPLPDERLHMTLSRRSSQVRQSAQIVLTSVPTSDFDLSLQTVDGGSGAKRRELELTSEHGLEPVCLVLNLSFLDYVMARQRGEISRQLQACYADRLERFKGQLLHAYPPETGPDLILVRLRTNRMFHQQRFTVSEHRLEVD